MASQTAAAEAAVIQKSEIDVEQPSLIVPAQATDESPLYLSNYDQQVMFNMETVYFYPPSQHRASDNVIEILREALAKLLVPYHFMAGRLRMNVAEGRVEVDCNRAGALFAGASTHLTFADLQDVGTVTSLLKDFILHEPTSSVSDAPLLTVQVTRFRCGGFVVGIARNHAVVGGASGNEFLSNFASLARGEGLQVTPVAETSLLKARDPPRPCFDHVEYQKVAGKVSSDSYFTTSRSLPDLELHGNFGEHFRLWKTFNFTADQLASLKHQAVAGGAVNACTTFEALATHVWRARTHAVNMEPDQLSNLLFVVDSRKVVKPPLPPGFTGNTLSLACAGLQSHELASRPFSQCVKKVQEAKARMTDEYVRSSIDWLEVNHGVPSVNGGIYLSSWTRFNFRSVDFGWGAPIETTFVPGARSSNCVVFLPSTQGSLDVCLALEAHQALKFEERTGGFLKWPPAAAAATASTRGGIDGSGGAAYQMAQRRRYSTSCMRAGMAGDIAGAMKRHWCSLKRWRI